MPLHLVRDDITRMKADAIVNAANQSLLGGGGVDGAIHRVAGPKLLEECAALGGCNTGDAKLTRGYNLPSKYVIHTVGPIWNGGTHGEEDLLRSCYRRSLEIARDNGFRSIAFPLISSGVFGYPKDEALRVARETIRGFLEENDLPVDVYLVIYDRASFRIASGLYDEIRAYIDDRYVGPDGYDTSSFDMAQLSRRRSLLSGRDESRSAARPRRRRREPGGMFGAHAAPMPNMAPQTLESAAWADSLLDDFMEQQEATFAEKLLDLIDESGMTDAECYKKANVDRRVFSKIRCNRDYHPKKGTAIAFAVALSLPLDETQDLLRSAGYTLTRSSRADLIVEFFIEQGTFDVLRINEALFRDGREPLTG